MDLMIDNALLFNGADSEVGIIAVQVRDKYRDMLPNVRGTAAKRKSSDKPGTPQPTKKVKLG